MNCSTAGPRSTTIAVVPPASRLQSVAVEPGPELIARCVRGERAAQETVLRGQAPALESLFMRLTGRRSDVEDLLQNTFVAAIRAFPHFRAEASVRSWLTRIGIAVFYDQLRRPERRSPHLELVSSMPAESDEPGPERRTEARRGVQRLAVHLAAIAPKKRVAFVLHVVDGHPLEEVAALMNASRTATKSRVFWARRELLRRARRDPSLSDWITEELPP
jgi:RNA polymerase sigma-70 factor (ECF subfamily)